MVTSKTLQQPGKQITKPKLRVWVRAVKNVKMLGSRGTVRY